MTPTPTKTLLLGGVFFLLAVVCFYLWLEKGSRSLFLMTLGAFVLSAFSFGLGFLLRRGPRDALELRRQQRLWKSGPLGRRWLGIRNRYR